VLGTALNALEVVLQALFGTTCPHDPPLTMRLFPLMVAVVAILLAVRGGLALQCYRRDAREARRVAATAAKSPDRFLRVRSGGACVVQNTRLGWLAGLGPLHLWGGVARPFDPRLGAHHAVVLAAHVATIAAVVALVLRTAASHIPDSPDAGDVEFAAPLGLDSVLLYFAAAFAAVAVAHAGAHLPLHWLLARCTLVDRRKLYAVRLGATNERFGARRVTAKWAGTPADVARADPNPKADSAVGASTAVMPDGSGSSSPASKVSRHYPKALSASDIALAARESAASWRTAAAPSVATHVRVRCWQSQRAALTLGCAVLVLMTAVAEVTAKPWCAAPTAIFNAVLGIALAVDAVVAQPLFVLLVWGWRWTRGDVARTAPYPIHGAWRTASAVGATNDASDSFTSGRSSGSMPQAHVP